MAGYFRVRNWTKFQHYGDDRTPPWIRLYNKLLENDSYSELPDQSKSHLVGIWLLASRLENKIPAKPAWIASKIGATTPIDLQILEKAGFIESLVANASVASLVDEGHARPEERRVEEIREETTLGSGEPETRLELASPAPTKTKPPWENGEPFDEFWALYPRKRHKASARRAFAKHRPQNGGSNARMASIKAKLDRYISREWAEREQQHIPYPASWLNAEEFA